MAINALLPVWDEIGVWTNAIAYQLLGQFEYVPLWNTQTQAIGLPIELLPPHVSPWPIGY